MIKIETVDPGSYAAELGLLAGDSILTINGSPVADILDYHLHINAPVLNLEIMHQDEIWDLRVEKYEEEDFGVTVEHPEPRQCGNQCQFCFVHQLPKGLRKTLYIKDEDYRFSYLYGSYITLTNLKEDEIQRIINLQLSPLYVSVHATDARVRENLLGVESPDVMPLIRRLVNAGIDLHCQIVLCPGLNDGQVLNDSIDTLASLFPRIASLAVVPVGLTQFRNKLPELTAVSEVYARQCLDIIADRQNAFLTSLGTRFVFAADELFLKAEYDLPDVAYYEDFSQLENGVGMIAQFRHQADEVLLEADALEGGRVSLVCGESFSRELQSFVDRMVLRTGISMHVIPVVNQFFGSTVTVSGLITGQDLIEQLKVVDLGEAVFIPDVMLKNGEDLFLDDLSVADLEAALGTEVFVVENTPWGILEGLELFTEGPEVIHCRE